MAIITKTIKPSGGDYTSLSAWNTAEATDLVADGDSHICECYKGDYGTGGGVNFINDSVYLSSSWNMNSSHTLTIKTPDAQRHTGRPKFNGDYTGFAIKSNATWSSVLSLGSRNNVTVDGLIADADADDGMRCFSASNESENNTIKNCIALNATYSGQKSFDFRSADIIALINCIAINSHAGFELSRYGFAKVYNCGAYDCSSDGYTFFNTGTADIAKNCWAKDCGTGFNGHSGGSHTIENCATDDTSLPTGSNNRNSQTFTFIDEAGNYFAPAHNDTALKGFGQDLSGIFTDDILGNTRSIPWDIGAFIFEIASSIQNLVNTEAPLKSLLGRNLV